MFHSLFTAVHDTSNPGFYCVLRLVFQLLVSCACDLFLYCVLYQAPGILYNLHILSCIAYFVRGVLYIVAFRHVST